MKFSCLGFGIWWKASPDPRETFYPSLQSPWLWNWAGTFALGTIQISLRCLKHHNHPTPQLLPPDRGGLLAVCHPQHIHTAFSGWHLLALPLSMKCLTVSHHPREAVVCALTSGAPGSVLGRVKTWAVGKDPLPSSLHMGLPSGRAGCLSAQPECQAILWSTHPKTGSRNSKGFPTSVGEVCLLFIPDAGRRFQAANTRANFGFLL